jgi:vacuolar-type H+-ATPase subunit F/Vma7
VLRVVCVMSRELSLGFSLTGVEVFPVEDPARALQAVQEFVAGREAGLIVIEERLLEGMADRDREELLDSSVPLVVPLPGELAWRDVEELPPDDYVAELIRRAVGYQLNVQL